MSSLYLGIRLPEKPYERLKLDDVNFSTKNIVDLKIDAEKLLHFAHSELGAYVVFVSCNNENVLFVTCVFPLYSFAFRIYLLRNYFAR